MSLNNTDSAKRIIIPKGLINPQQTTIIEIPSEYASIDTVYAVPVTPWTTVTMTKSKENSSLAPAKYNQPAPIPASTYQAQNPNIQNSQVKVPLSLGQPYYQRISQINAQDLSKVSTSAPCSATTNYLKNQRSNNQKYFLRVSSNNNDFKYINQDFMTKTDLENKIKPKRFGYESPDPILEEEMTSLSEVEISQKQLDSNYPREFVAQQSTNVPPLVAATKDDKFVHHLRDNALKKLSDSFTKELARIEAEERKVIEQDLQKYQTARRQKIQEKYKQSWSAL